MDSQYGRCWTAVCAAAVVLAAAAGPARALDPPKVAVTYSLEVREGGGLIMNATRLPLDPTEQTRAWVNADAPSPDDPTAPPHCADAVEPLPAECRDTCLLRPDDPDCSALVDVLTDSPMTVVIEYTADPDTLEIVDGPVELLDFRTVQLFRLFFPSEEQPEWFTEWDYEETLAGALAPAGGSRPVRGVLSGDAISWNKRCELNGAGCAVDANCEADSAGRCEAFVQTSQVGDTSCWGVTNGGIAFCLSAGLSLERVEDGTPRQQPRGLPSFSVSPLRNSFEGDNLTPLDELDDILQHEDETTTIFHTWKGAQMRRFAVPEPGSGLLVSGAVLTLAALRRRRLRERASGRG